MSRLGRVEILAHKDGDYFEVLDLKFLPSRDFYGDAIIQECGIDLSDFLEGRACGVHLIWGAYHEHWTQDYWGEWDGDFKIENIRFRFCGLFLDEKNNC